MTRVYDDVTAQRANLPGDVPRKAGGTHIGIFFAWCVERGLASPWHEEHHREEYERLQRRWHSGRDYVLGFLDGKLTDEHLGKAAREFAESYYVPGTYLLDYERTLLAKHPTLYHVPDRPESLDAMAAVLDERFDVWRKGGGVPAVSAPPLPPDPFARPHPHTDMHTDTNTDTAEPVLVPAPEPTPEPEPEPEPTPAPEPEPELAPTPEPEPAPKPFEQLPSAYAPSAPTIQSEPIPDPAPAAPFEVDTPAPGPRPWDPPASPADRPPTARESRRQPRHEPWSAPHRTTKAWKTTKKGSGWALVMIFALLYGCMKCTQSSKKSRRENNRRNSRTRNAPRRTPSPPAPRLTRPPQPRTVQVRPDPVEPLRKAPWPVLSKHQQNEARRLRLPIQFENSIGMRFVLIPSGDFIMGSPLTEPGRHDGEVPHNVELTRPFYASITEVTNAQFRKFRRLHESESPPGLEGFNKPDVPVTSVGHESAEKFCRWLTNQDSARRYRLPTEAEWEFASRAGTQTRWYWGDAELVAGRWANVADTSARLGWPRSVRIRAERDSRWTYFSTVDSSVSVSAVAQYGANPWGLYDTIGNVAEWCSDRAAAYDTTRISDPNGSLHGTRRIFRGGAFDTPVWQTRAAFRAAERPIRTAMNLGFRVVAEPKQR